MKVSTLFFTAILAITVSVNKQAQAQAVHSHGLATLTLGLEGAFLEIEFESPAMNLIGFEYQAKTAKDKQVVANAVGLLKAPQALFTFLEARCALTASVVDVSSVIRDESKHHHHDHSQGHSNHDDVHSEIVASYQFTCVDANQLNAISVALFDKFPGIEKINAMWVTDSQQGAKELNPSSRTFSLR